MSTGSGAEEDAFEATKQKIQCLEAQLAAQRQKLESLATSASTARPDNGGVNSYGARPRSAREEAAAAGRDENVPRDNADSLLDSILPPEALHPLLLLSDSAFPLGSFAFSSGLESYLQHNASPRPSLSYFLPSSLSSYSSTTLPYFLAAFRDPALDRIAELDDELDATMVCSVGRRASVSQGRALVGIWERSLQSHFPASNTAAPSAPQSQAATTLGSYSSLQPKPNHHLAPLMALLCLSTSIPLQPAAYVFLLSHVKSLVSAAVRASVMGPYQAQKVLASPETRRMIEGCLRRDWDLMTEEAGQTVPVVDLWMGRHEVLYSRIFNS